MHHPERNNRDEEREISRRHHWSYLLAGSVLLFVCTIALLLLSVWHLTVPLELQERIAGVRNPMLQDEEMAKIRMLVQQEIRKANSRDDSKDLKEMAQRLLSSQSSLEQRLGPLGQETDSAWHQITQLRSKVEQMVADYEKQKSDISLITSNIAEISYSHNSIKDTIKSTSDTLNIAIAQLEAQFGNMKCEAPPPLPKMDWSKASSSQLQAATQNLALLETEARKQSQNIENLKRQASHLENKAREMVSKQELEQFLEKSHIPITPEGILQHAGNAAQDWVRDAIKAHVSVHQCVDESQVKSLTQTAIELYSADQIGLTDLASKQEGGKIVRKPGLTSPSYKTSMLTTADTMFKRFLFGNDWTGSEDEVIMPVSKLRHHWAFAGSRGRVTIELARSDVVSAISLEHISKLKNPDFSAAPKNFQVWGLDSPEAAEHTYFLLGNFTYSDEGDPVQTYSTLGSKKAFKFVMLEVLSNYGNPEFTCIYRFRVHSQ